MRSVDLGGDPGAIAAFRLDCRSQTGILCAELEFQSPTPDGELRFYLLDSGALLGIEVELLVQQVVERAFLVTLLLGQAPPDENPSEGGKERE